MRSRPMLECHSEPQRCDKMIDSSKTCRHAEDRNQAVSDKQAYRPQKVEVELRRRCLKQLLPERLVGLRAGLCRWAKMQRQVTIGS